MRSITDALLKGDPCRTQAPMNYTYSGPGFRIATRDGQDWLRVIMADGAPSGGVDSSDDKHWVSFGPAYAEFRPVGRPEQKVYVPAGEIGYIQLRDQAELSCRMVSSGATASGRRLARRLWEIKSRSDAFWFRVRNPY
jgi:hypothetical protein